ncbi:MAG: L-aspartate oxidase [Bacteroidetes bacterium]|nr:L-aspartate oxidase [Bacteroidota bacterium]
MQKRSDFLVIGSGITGLIFALKVADKGKVNLISKTTLPESNTRYAQGGIAAVMYPPDSIEKHVKDTLDCGRGLCNESIVRLIIGESPDRIRDLINLGTQFDTDHDGKYNLGREGGHSEYRVLHHKDNTGQEIIRALEKKVREHPNIEIFENHFAIEIITQHHLGHVVTKHFPGIKCYGTYVLNPATGKVETFLAKKILMATGGAGMIYNNTTNPIIATGDGVAMVHRARGIVENMEFVQFHPTSLYNLNQRPSFLITEAIRGFGAVLKTLDGKEFMHKYDPRKSLAPRDVVARAIDQEMKISGDDHVCLDCTQLNSDELINKFPTIFEKCLSLGIDIRKDMIPVVPSAHYICGGIKTDAFGKSSIINLYAAGECASTGMHGANRMASNSLLEALVMANRAAESAVQEFNKTEIYENVPDWNAEGTVLNEEMILIIQSLREVQSIMSNYVGIVRSNLRLKRAFNRLNLIFRETEELYIKSILSPRLCELRNIISVAYLVIKHAMKRTNSIGLHYSLDYSDSKIEDL